jgi:assimilatory nitrate reductase catalytic subunit
MATPNLKTRTTCPYCGVGCGVLAWRDTDGRVQVKGDPEHPSNFGRLCSKGSALHETVDLGGRLLYPQMHGERVSWDTALTAVAAGFAQVLAEHGPEAIAFYGSGQLLTEDYYVANKLIKGFLGSANIDTNSRLCMASSVAGHKRAFGSDTVPGCYEDLELAELVVLIGSNLAWCHPILYQRLKAAKERRPQLKVVVIDPRRTDSCEIADLHLALKNGTDVWLFNGLLRHLAAGGALDRGFIESRTEGLEAALAAAAEQAEITAVAGACGLKESELARFYEWFAACERTVSVYSQGVNQSSAGTDKVNAIINCHLLTGRIGRPGMGPFSVTGQPNAMGGREVGGLANQLAAHMDFAPADVARVCRFWQAPRLADKPGLKAIDLFEAVHAGKIKAIWIMATNPVVSLPDAERVRAALRRCPLVVVSDCMAETDTTGLADILLPALGWGEKNGSVTNSERRISRQRPFLPPPGEAKPDWWIICEVAKRMGFERAFDYRAPAQIFAEHAALSAFENGGRRDFDLSALTALSGDDYDALEPVQWPVRADGDRARLFGDGDFFTASGKARFIAVTARAPVHAPEAGYPLILNSGRVRDHWHTLTRSGKSPRLNQHIIEPYLALHPEDAAALDLEEDAIVEVESRWGRALVRARLDKGLRPGEVFAPMHWSDRYSARARIDAVVSPDVDPLSGEPEFKHTPVRVRPLPVRWYGFLLSREPLPAPPVEYWTRIGGRGYERLELADSTKPGGWRAWAQAQLLGPGEWLEFHDPARGLYRAARLREGALIGCVFIGPSAELPARDWLGGLFVKPLLSGGERLALLSGRAPGGAADEGRTVCACFGVGEKRIRAAIRGGARTPAAVTRALKAGGNCGSCLPEIKRLIDAQEAAVP